MTTSSHNPNPLEILFVDQSITDYQSLVDGIVTPSSDRQMVVVTLDYSDGIEQISNELAQYSEQIEAVHIVSHGSPGSVQLGSATLDTNSLNGEYDELIGTWSNAFTDDGDLLFYGCNLGSGTVGQALVDQLATVTGADVAASDDLTGNAALGGDWDLEYASGSIEGQSPWESNTLATYGSVFATINTNTTISSDQTYNDLTINDNVTLTIDGNVTLNVGGDFTLSSLASSARSPTLYFPKKHPQISVG